MRVPLLFILAGFAGPAMGQDCPEAPDHADEISALMEDLASSASASDAQELSNDLWELWTDAPDAQSQTLLNLGMRARARYDFVSAFDHFDRLIAYCPDFAEGYNQRAFASYLRTDFEAALADLDKALELNPTHIGALSGKALSLMGLGRQGQAQVVLRQALELNPWLSERSLLIDPPGTDI
ncbi:tetratricopeptide repeat protein [Pseudoroseicyclus sp. H15]